MHGYINKSALKVSALQASGPVVYTGGYVK